MARKLYTHAAILENRVFAVNILNIAQGAWGMRFASIIPEIGDRFADIDFDTATTGCAILPGVLGWLDCTVRHAYDGGDHTSFWRGRGRRFRGTGPPLLYFNRHWRQLAGGALSL